jgi:hypothetical protein
MALADTAGLVDLFRQAWSPLNQLSSGRLALAQQQLEREAQQRIWEQRQQQAFLDHLSGLRLQGDQAQQLEQLRAQKALELENIRAGHALEATNASVGTAGYWSNKTHEADRMARSVDEARRLQANLGISDVDPELASSDPAGYVAQIDKAAAAVASKHRGAANVYAKELTQIDSQLKQLTSEADVPESRAVAIARPLLVAAATDDKKKAAYKKLTSLDDIMNAAGDEIGALDKINGAIDRERLIRNQTFTKKSTPLLSRQGNLQRTLIELGKKGIDPDPESWQMPTASTGAAAPADSEGDGLTADDVNNVFKPASGASTASGGGNSHLLETAAGLGLAAASPPGRAVIKGAAKAAGPLARATIGRIPAIGSSIAKFGVRGAAGPVGAASFINDVPTMFGGEPMSATLAGLTMRATGNDFGGELARQRDAIAQIDSLIPRVDPATAARLRALKYSSNPLDSAQIGAVLDPSNLAAGSGNLPSY